MNSYSQFLCSAIKQEFNNLFSTSYSDDMFQSIVFYTDAHTTLKNNRYNLRVLDDGFSLYHKGEFFAEINMGAFSAPFLNAWIQEQATGMTLFPVGFNKTNPKDMQGALSRFSDRYMDELTVKEVTHQQADAGIIEIFLSDSVVCDGDEGIFRVDPRTIKPISRVDFEDDGVVSFEDDLDEEEDSPVVTKAPSSNEKEALPFYYVINMEKRGKRLANLPKIWKKKIEEDGLSWEFTDGLLYVSNTKGSSYGLPPAPHHLRNLPKLELDLGNWEEDTPSKTENKNSSNEPALSVCSDLTGDTEWEKITAQFMDSPCSATFDSFKEAPCVDEAFDNHKHDRGYKMGSNKNPLSGLVRKVIRGEDNAISWTDFTELIRTTAKPSDTKAYMILLFKFRLYVKQTRDGKVYVEK